MSAEPSEMLIQDVADDRRNFLDDPSSPGRQSDIDYPAVIIVSLTAHQALVFQAVEHAGHGTGVDTGLPGTRRHGIAMAVDNSQQWRPLVGGQIQRLKPKLQVSQKGPVGEGQQVPYGIFFSLLGRIALIELDVCGDRGQSSPGDG